MAAIASTLQDNHCDAAEIAFAMRSLRKAIDVQDAAPDSSAEFSPESAAERALCSSSLWLLVVGNLPRPFCRGLQSKSDALSLLCLCRATAAHATALYRTQCPLSTPTAALTISSPLTKWRAEALLWAVLERLPRGDSVAIAGSFALHAYMRSRVESGDDALEWAPGDVDVYLTESAPRKKRGRGRGRKTDGGNLAVFVRRIVSFADRVEAELGVTLRVKPPPACLGGELTLGHMRAYLEWCEAETRRTGVVSVPPKTSPLRLCVEQHPSLPSFGVLPKLEEYVRYRSGGFCFFLIDLMLPPTLARAGFERISFIGGRDWILDWGEKKLAESSTVFAQAAAVRKAVASPRIHLERIFADFDLDVCQVGMRMVDLPYTGTRRSEILPSSPISLRFELRDEVAAAIQRREVSVVTEGHIKTPSRIRKYEARGFSIVGRLGAALQAKAADFYDVSENNSHGRPVFKGRIEAVREALRCTPDDAKLHYWLATMLLGTGERAECLVALREVLRIDPTHTRAVKLANKLERRALDRARVGRGGGRGRGRGRGR